MMYREETGFRMAVMSIAILTALLAILLTVMPVSGAQTDDPEMIRIADTQTQYEYSMRLLLQNLFEKAGIVLIALSLGVTAMALLERKTNL